MVELLRGPNVYWDDAVLETGFLQHDENLLHVRAGQRVEVDHVRLPG